ncbi:MAG: Gfo/Idh/MocA family oxidoreductase [Acidimicrobiia bacterium]
MLKPHGVGIVGYGRFGRTLHDAWREKVTAVHDRRAVDPGESVTNHPSLAALLEDPAVEIVAVATEPSTHAAIATEALAADRHVIVEKPLATDERGAKMVAQTATRRGLVVTVDHVLIAHPLVTAAISLAEDGLLGSPVSFGVTNFAASDHLGPQHWFWDPARSGGILVEHGVHFFDLALRILGEAQETWACPIEEGGARIGETASVCHPNGVSNHVHVFSRTRASESTSIEVGFQRGTLRLDGWIPLSGQLVGDVEGADSLFPNASIGKSADPPVRRIAFHMDEDKSSVYRGCLQRILRWTVEAIDKGVPAPVDLGHARQALDTALACRGAIA